MVRVARKGRSKALARFPYRQPRYFELSEVSSARIQDKIIEVRNQQVRGGGDKTVVARCAQAGEERNTCKSFSSVSDNREENACLIPIEG